MTPANVKKAAPILAQIERLTKRAKELGVIFKPVDAVMPEIMAEEALLPAHLRSTAERVPRNHMKLAAGPAITVMIAGPQGSGKTLLADAFEEFLRHHGRKANGSIWACPPKQYARVMSDLQYVKLPIVIQEAVNV